MVDAHDPGGRSGRSHWVPNAATPPASPASHQPTYAPPPTTQDEAATQYTASGHGSGSSSGMGWLPAGTMLGEHLRIERILGSGGMGVVYLATNLRLQRPVAVKVQRSDDSGNTQRLIREAQSLARLTHPNVLTVYDVGKYGDAVYIAMEYVDGGTARQWLQQRRRTWRQVLDLYVQAARGLAAAHAAGIVHRDFKPENLLLGNDGRARVADFGIAQGAGSGTPARTHAASPDAVDPRLTMTGGMLGTPAYMAPEQFDGTPVDGRADQFAFCVCLYEALHAERPFRGPSPAELLLQVRAGAISPPSGGARIPKWLDQTLRRGLHPDPAQRHASMDALITELTRVRGSKWLWPVVVGSSLAAVAFITAGIVGWMAVQDDERAGDDPEPGQVSTSIAEVVQPEPITQPPSQNAEHLEADPKPEEPSAAADPPSPPDLPPVSKEPLWDGRSTLLCAGDMEYEIIDKTVDVAEGPAFRVGGDCKLTIRNSDITADVVVSGGGSDQVHVVLEDSKVRAKTSVVKMGGSARVDVTNVEVLAPCEAYVFDVRGDVEFRIAGTSARSAEVLYVSGGARAHIVDGRFEGSKSALVATGNAQVILGTPEFVGPTTQTGNAVLRRHSRD